ncbi:hypothetical protein BJP27_23805 (plasmid) [Pseudomonas oryzihabitans]|nr:hypothetical protein BJP27_23805 [Pseudomonas psychrotolerans]
MSDQRTPSSTWREQSEADPHGDRYSCERAALPMGDMTDDQLANAVFMNGNRAPTEADLLAGHAPSST